MAARARKHARLIVLSLCALLCAAGLSAHERRVPVLERRPGGLAPSPAGATTGEFPAARQIHDFDRPSIRGLRRVREASARRLLRGAAAPPDSWRVAVVRVSFDTDRSGSLTSMRTGGDFDLTPDGTSVIDPTPHNKAYFNAHMEAMARFFEFQSCGAVSIDWEVLPAGDGESYHLGDLADYGPGRGGVWTDAALVSFVHDAVVACDEALAASGYPVRLSDFDAIVLAHAGANLQSDVLGNSPNDMPSFFARLGDEDEFTIENGSYLITELSVIPETAIQDGYNGGIAAVLAHEFGHQLGLPDLYDTYTNMASVGVFDNMDSGGQLGAIVLDDEDREQYVEGFVPSGLGAWSRYFLGWAAADTVRTFDDMLALPAVEKCPARLVRFEISSDEYYLAENRAAEIDGLPTGYVTDPETGVVLGPGNCMNCGGGIPDEIEWEFTNGYDLLLPTESASPGPDGGPGLLLWHVDEYFIERRWEANEVNSRWPFGVSIVEASGVVDLGDPTSRFGLGWYDDAFYAGNATVMSDSTLPPAWSNWGVPTGIRLENVSSRDTLMTFGAGARDVLSTKMTTGGWWPAGYGLVQLGASRSLVVDTNGFGRLSGAQQPVFSLRENGAEDDLPLTPALYVENLSGTMGVGAVVLAGRSGTIHIWRGDDWSEREGGWPVHLDSLVTHPVALVIDPAGIHIAAADRSGALFLIRGDDVAASASALRLFDNLTFTGNLAAEIDREGWNTGLFSLSRERDDPAGVWLTRYDIAGGVPAPDGGYGGFIPASAAELAGSVYLVGGDAVPEREGSEMWVVFGSSGRAVMWGRGERLSERRLGTALIGPPAVLDVNRDGRLDLVCADDDHVWVIEATGANVTGWPRSVNGVFALPTQIHICAPPVAATDQERRSFVAVPTDAGILFVFDEHGELEPGWPRKIASSFMLPVDLVSYEFEGMLSYVDQVFDWSGSGFLDYRPEGGRARWRSAPFYFFGGEYSWDAVYGGPMRQAFALDSQQSSSPSADWADIESNLVIYPNPSSGDRVAFHFTAPESGEARLWIMTLDGETLIERTMGLFGGEAEFAVSMTGKAAGIYLGRITITSQGRTVEAHRKFAIVN